MAVTTIPTAGIADGAVDTAQLADDAVTAAKATGFGKIGQVVTATVGSTVSTSSGVYSDVSGFTANITPSATSSKILVQSYVFADISAGAGTAGTGYIRLLRGSTTIETASEFLRYRVGNGNPDQIKAGLYHSYMDSPSSTSQLTYKYQFSHSESGSFSIISGAKIMLMEVLA